jgi:nucleoside diphosphate kinase
MGATSSILPKKDNIDESILSDCIYVSYPKNCKNQKIIKICKYLEEQGYTVVESKMNIIYENDEMVESVYKQINTIIQQCYYVIVFMSPDTIYSLNQIVELNSVFDKNTNIIYLMTNSNYTPINNPGLYSVIDTHQWFSAYDEDSFDDTVHLILEIFKSK